VISLFYLSYDQSKKEGFNPQASQSDTLGQLTNLLTQLSGNLDSSGNNPNMTAEQQSVNRELVPQLNNLNASLQVLINQNKLNTPLEQAPPSSVNLSVLNDAKIQQIRQDELINELKSRLNNLQTIYNSYLQKKTETSNNYNKIPVTSSCIVSEANGDFTATPQPTS
jgi:hypothetical protein